jgi:hypothetical protein
LSTRAGNEPGEAEAVATFKAANPSSLPVAPG